MTHNMTRGPIAPLLVKFTVPLVLGNLFQLTYNAADSVTYVPYVIGSRYMNAINTVHDNSLNIERLYFDSTVKDYTDSLNAVVYRQEPEMSEEPLKMGSAMNLFLTVDKNKVPPRPEPEITID